MRYLFLLILFTFSAMAEDPIKEMNLDIDSRWVVNTEGYDRRERLQGRVRVGFTVDANGLFEIIGIAATGSNFDGAWGTITDTNQTKAGRQIVFRNLYLRKTFENVTVEAGAMNAEPTIGAGGLAPSGWMDGVRVSVDTNIGDFKVVAGSLGGFDEPNAFKRKFKGNFIEIEMDQTVFDRLLSETGIQHYNDDIYLRQNLSTELSVLGGRVLSLFAGALYDFKREALSYDVGVEVDVLESIFGMFKDRLQVRVYYSYVDEEMPLRSETLSSFHTYGPRVSVHLSGRIDRRGYFNWYYRASEGRTDRQDVGLTLRIPLQRQR